MREEPEKVVVAMSGGVDSSTAAYLLKERGFQVTGVFFKGEAHPAGKAVDAEDARSVAQALGIDFSVLDFTADLESLIDYFCDEYSRGRTPNPCVICNARHKFGKLAEHAARIGARYLATGHYARIQPRGDRFLLMRGIDATKDQSYMLYQLRQEQLSRTIFPLGELRKTEVRSLAARLNLKVSHKRESQDICFVPEGDYRVLLRRRCPDRIMPGLMVETSGKLVGRHKGIQLYTIGQRHGLGVALGEPRYVVRLDGATNEVVIGNEEDLARRDLLASGLNWIAFDRLEREIECEAQIRYRHKPAKATVVPEGENARVIFHEPEKGVAPGQAVVFYDGDVVLGGGWIAG